METKATFRLFGGAELTAAAVTLRLGVEPTWTAEAGDRVSSRSSLTRGSSAWLLSSSSCVESGTELSEHLHRLLTILEPVAARLWELVREGYDANWFCLVASHPTERAAELDRTIMQRLLALPGDLWLNVWNDGTEDQ